jgi:streptomycin 6-kinase
MECCVVVHGDPHPGNALCVPVPRAGAESGFVFVDLDGFLADPAYDLGVVIRDWNSRLPAGDAASPARRYCRLLADHTGLDQRAIWEWGYLERVSTGLYILERGAEDLARPYLETAERLL